MLTFLEFYQTFLSFINYRLYTSINLVYPPKVDIDQDDAGAGLLAYQIQPKTEEPKAIADSNEANTLPVKDITQQLATLPSTLNSLVGGEATSPKDAPPETNDDVLDTFTSQDPSSALPQPIDSTPEISNALFQGLNIYLSRETPVDALTFLLLSFGVTSLSTDPISGPSPYPESDARITHQIYDRSRLPESIVPGRKYVQPQWVVDSINKGILQDEGLYVPGAELPPHLSPFVEKSVGTYDPEESVEVEDEEEEEVDEEEVEDQDTEYQRELVAEAAGVATKESKKNKKKKSKKDVDAEADREGKDMAKIMLSNKKKRLLEAMEYGNNKRRGELEKLKGRKRQLVREEQKRKKVKLG
jgi:pescadillo